MSGSNLNSCPSTGDRHQFLVVHFRQRVSLYIDGLRFATWTLNADEQTRGTGVNFGVAGDSGSNSAKRVYLYDLYIASAPSSRTWRRRSPPDTVLTQAEADDGTSIIQGQVNGLRLLDAVTTHSTANHAIEQVARIPAIEGEPLIYLTHNYTDAGRTDTSIGPATVPGGSQYGWANGRLFASAGSITRADTGCIIAVLGIEQATTYIINEVWSYNRACFAGATAVRIDGTDYTDLQLRSSLGAWVLEVVGAPEIANTQTSFTFNVVLGTDWIFESTTGTEFSAGLYAWDSTSSTYARLDGDISAVTTTASSGLDGGQTSGDVALILSLRRLGLVNAATVDPDADFIGFADESTTDDRTFRIRVDNFLDSVDGYGLAVGTGGLLEVDGAQFLATEAFEPGEDRLVFASNDNSNALRRRTWTSIAQAVTAGDTDSG